MGIKFITQDETGSTTLFILGIGGVCAGAMLLGKMMYDAGVKFVGKTFRPYKRYTIYVNED